jgi:dUTP pyrophosphatase
MEIKVKKLHPSSRVPKRQKNWDAGYDLYSCETFSISPMERKIVPVGIAIEIPMGYYGRIAPRSGLAAKRGIDVLGGVIDSGYRDEIKVILINLNLPETLFEQGKPQKTYTNLFGSRHRVDINEGDRVAQLIIEKCYFVTWAEEELAQSDRGTGGLGSTGN